MEVEIEFWVGVGVRGRSSIAGRGIEGWMDRILNFVSGSGRFRLAGGFRVN